MAVTVRVSGLKELDAKLKQIGAVAGQKAMRSSLFAASKPILDQAKANTARWPRGSGALNLSLGRRFSVSQNVTEGSRFTIGIGPRAKARAAIALYNLVYKRKRPIRGIFYGHLLEFRHKDRAGGDVEARPFLLPALQTKHEEATRLLAQKLEQEIAKAAAK